MTAFTDCMVDLETLGNSAGCVILSIGAVFFDRKTGAWGPTFYEVINTDSCLHHNLMLDESTVNWWNDQSEDARQVLREAKLGGIELEDALRLFANYLRQFGPNVCLWGNGSDFDNPILAFAYKITGVVRDKDGYPTTPWLFWNSRCYRTLKSLKPSIKLGPRQGTYHNALDDAITQAEHAIRLFGGMPQSRQSAVNCHHGVPSNLTCGACDEEANPRCHHGTLLRARCANCEEEDMIG